jgi:hypothetical protein
LIGNPKSSEILRTCSNLGPTFNTTHVGMTFRASGTTSHARITSPSYLWHLCDCLFAALAALNACMMVEKFPSSNDRPCSRTCSSNPSRRYVLRRESRRGFFQQSSWPLLAYSFRCSRCLKEKSRERSRSRMRQTPYMGDTASEPTWDGSDEYLSDQI